jgi:hypothetical protein
MQIVVARRWLENNSALQGQVLVQAAAKQDWEPCIQALVLFPSIIDQMDANLKWAIALGNAFLAQPQDLLLAVQRKRAKAYASGALQSNANQKVEVQRAEGGKTIVIHPASPDVIYGVAAGGWPNAAWGWGIRWGAAPALYVNNTFINRYGFHGTAYAGRTGIAEWAHNPYYRGAVPYTSAAVAKRYGTARGVTSARALEGASRQADPMDAFHINHEVTRARGSASRSGLPGITGISPGTYTNPLPDLFETGLTGRVRLDSIRGNESLGRHTR